MLPRVGSLRYGREVAVMPQNVAERVAKRGESQEFVDVLIPFKLDRVLGLPGYVTGNPAFSRYSSWS